MGVIGSFLDVVFEVREDKVNTFTNFTRSGEARYEKHDIKHQKPLTEFEGPDLDDLSFDVKLSANLGVNPTTELAKWVSARNTGQSGMFVLGNIPISNTGFVIRKITETHTTFDGKGNVLTIELNIELLEYPMTIHFNPPVPVSTPPAPAAKGLLGTMTIKVKSVHIRSGPGVNNKVLGYAYNGDDLQVYGNTNGWYDLGSGRFITASSQYSNFKGVT